MTNNNALQLRPYPGKSSGTCIKKKLQNDTSDDQHFALK